MTNIQSQLKSLQNNQKLLGLLIFSLITVVIWIGISLITSQTSTAISSEELALAAPMDPSINTTVLDQIALKRTYPSPDLANFPIFIVLNESTSTSILDGTSQTLIVQPGTEEGLEISPGPTLEATDSAQPTPTPEVSPAPTETPVVTP